MAVKVSKSGGIYIEISGDYTQLQADLKQVDTLGKAAGKSISDALSGSLRPNEAARNATNLSRYLATAQRAAKALSADLSGNDKQFREMGRAIGVAESQLGSFVKMQRQMYQTQAQKAFENNLKGIQRLTGSTDAEMNRLAKSMGGVGSEFGRATDEVKSFSASAENATRTSQSLFSVFKGIAGVAAGYVSMRAVGSFIGQGLSYNSTLQDAQTAIAATLAYTNKLVDAQGNLLQGQQAYNEALRMSEEIAKAIDAATVTASADYTQLLQAFQSTLGPASQVKATWQESLGLLTLMSNAMQVLNVDMQRLDKEMLAFMTGKDFSNSQVARNLGISPETVKQWRDSGNFVKEMTAALDQFRYAGEQSATSFKAVSRDLSGTIESLASDMTRGLLDRVTKSMSELSRSFYTLEKDGAKSVYVLRDEMAPLVLLGSDIATAFGDTARAGVQSFISGLESVSAFVEENRRYIDGLGNGIAFVASNVQTLIVAYVAWRIASSAVNGSIGYQIALLRGSVTQIGITRTAILSLSSAATAARAGIGGIVAAMGGPWVLGITAAAAAITYLATQEDAATKFAREHADAMLMVSNNADTAKQAMDAYSKKLAEMNTRQREFEQARIARERTDITSGGSAYRTIVNDITPWAISDSRSTEIRQKLSEAAQVVLPSNIASASIKDLENLRDRVTEIATEYGRTKEAADALTTIDSLIVLAKQAEAASKSLDDTANSVAGIANALNSLDAQKVATAIGALEQKVEQARRTAVGQASASALMDIGVSSKDIDRFGNVSQEIFAKYDEATQASILKTQALAKELYGLSSKARSAGASASRTAFQASEAYERAVSAAEQLRLKNAELIEELNGTSLSSALAKIQREYQSQLDAVEKRERELLSNRAQFAKAGKLDTFAEAQNEIAAQKQLLDANRKLNEEIARRADLERTARANMDYAGLIGDLQAYYAEEAKLLALQMERASAAEKVALAERQRIAQARADLDVGGMFQTGMAKMAEDAQRRVIDFWEKTIPESIGAVTDTFGTLFADIATGTKSASDAFADMGKTFQSIAHTIISELINMTVRMALFGQASQGTGGTSVVGGVLGWIGGLFPSAKGNVIASPSLSAYSNSIVSSPTIFPFAKGGVGLMGEAGSEAIMPLTRTSTGDLGVQVDLGGGRRGGDTYFYFTSPITVEYTAPESSTPEADGQKMAESLGAQLRKEMQGFVRQEMITQSRPGGLLNAGIGA